MISHQDLIDQFGEDGLLYIPADRLEGISFDPMGLSPEGAIPAQVPLLFTAYLEGDLALFNILEIQIGEQSPLGLLVLGAVPDEKMYYCLDGDSGAVKLLDLGQPVGIEVVNSNLAVFVEFLLQLDRFIRADQGKAGRADRAVELRRQLVARDPAAFNDPESWWSIAFSQLEDHI